MAFGTAVDYRIDVGNPFQQAIDQYKGLTGLFEAQRKLIQQEAMQRDFAALANNPAPQASDYVRLMTLYPSLSEHFERGRKSVTEQQMAANLKDATQAYAAVIAGRNDIAKQILEERASALTNSGQHEEAQHYRVFGQLLDSNPGVARTIVGLAMAGALGPDKFGETLAKIGGERRAEDLHPDAMRKGQAEAAEAAAKAQYAGPQAAATLDSTQAGTANTRSQQAERDALLDPKLRREDAEARIKAAAAGEAPAQEAWKTARERAEARKAEAYAAEAPKMAKAQAQKEQREAAMPDSLRKDVDAAAQQAAQARQSAQRAAGLAERFEQFKGAGMGKFSGASEWLAAAFGNQDELTALRNEYTRLRNSEAIKTLPPGPATDRDIELALKGLPPETADAEYLATFLRGVAKMSRIEATVAGARADWLQANGSLGRAQRDIEVSGIRVGAGVEFADFAQVLAESVTARLGSAAPARPAQAPAPAATAPSPAPAQPQDGRPSYFRHFR